MNGVTKASCITGYDRMLGLAIVLVTVLRSVIKQAGRAVAVEL